MIPFYATGMDHALLVPLTTLKNLLMVPINVQAEVLPNNLDHLKEVQLMQHTFDDSQDQPAQKGKYGMNNESTTIVVNVPQFLFDLVSTVCLELKQTCMQQNMFFQQKST